MQQHRQASPGGGHQCPEHVLLQEKLANVAAAEDEDLIIQNFVTKICVTLDIKDV